MKRSLFFTALFVCALFSSCQCADPPDVGPVEGEEESAQVRLDDRADRFLMA
jgi:hypothetical protein